MGKLSFKSYASKCVLGAEIVYTACIVYGFTLGVRVTDSVAGSADRINGAALHHELFNLLPGFTWFSFGSFVIGALDIAIFAVIFGWYMVWVHNTSLIKIEK